MMPLGVPSGVPLVLIGFEVWQNLRLAQMQNWLAAYKWPIYFFISVAFWNLVGAGLFGFFINPPIALYYMQGLNTTPLHGHTALFGVYGMLGIGLMLFCLRALRPDLRVVLTTGYSESADKVANENFHLLLKPYRIDALSEAIAKARYDTH